MKGIGFYRYGGPEVLKEVEVQDPKPGAGEVVVRVIGTSMNRIDILVRLGYHGLKLDMPHLPGTDIVGRIEKVGKGVKGIAQGELVTANTIFGCGNCSACRAGDEPLCRKWKMVGLQTDGAYGELVKLPASVIYRPQKKFSQDEVSAMPLGLSMAWKAINSVGKGKEGDVVLVRGASGNVGIFAVMIAKAMHMKVIALSRSQIKRKKLKGIGADIVIDSGKTPEEIKKEVMDFTSGEGADLVIESFGGTLNDSIALARYGGKVVLFGTIAGVESSVSVPPFYLRCISVIGMHNASFRELAQAFEFASKHNIRPIIARKMKVSDARQAHTILQNSGEFGKIILKHDW